MKAKTINEFITIIYNYKDLIIELFDKDGHRADRYTVIDIIKRTNGNVIVWTSSKGDIGSTGTYVIVTTLSYLALLSSVIEKIQTDANKEVPIHVMLDEIGMIERNNMRQIVNFANENGLLFLNAAPNSQAQDVYKYIYVYKISGNKSIVKKGVTTLRQGGSDEIKET